jgi:hypothetical protein
MDKASVDFLWKYFITLPFLLVGGAFFRKIYL